MPVANVLGLGLVPLGVGVGGKQTLPSILSVYHSEPLEVKHPRRKPRLILCLGYCQEH